MTKIPAAAQGSDTRPADSGDVDPLFRYFASTYFLRPWHQSGLTTIMVTAYY